MKHLEILKVKEERVTTILLRLTLNISPAPIERKQVYGVTFEQGRNEFEIDKELLDKCCYRE